MNGPDPDKRFPNGKVPSLCFIKNVITRPNIIVGDYTYYDDDTGAEDFEKHVTHHYEFIGDKLIIGKFCAIGKGGGIYHERRQSSDEQRDDVPVQYHGRRLGKMYAASWRFAAERGYDGRQRRVDRAECDGAARCTYRRRRDHRGKFGGF